MVGAIECEAGEPGLNPSVVTSFFSFIFLKNTKFCSAGRIAWVSTHPVTDE